MSNILLRGDGTLSKENKSLEVNYKYFIRT